MGDQRDGGIAWTDQTWNPVRGCSRVSEGCRNCYAESVARRFSGPGQPYEGLANANGWTREVRLVPERLGDPIRWKRPRRVFVNSMSDLFHESLPFEQIAAIFGVMAAAPQHTFQVLTKRPERATEFFAWLSAQDPATHPRLEACWQALVAEREHHPDGDSGLLHTERSADPEGPWPLPNVWLGVSVEDQDATRRVDTFARLPAAVRFVSQEPQIEPITWTDEQLASVGWLIVGGESGHRARPFDIAWARQTIAQCREAGVPVFVKQLGRFPLLPSVEPTYPMKIAADRERALAMEWPDGTRFGNPTGDPALNGRVVLLADRAGANPAEWPADLRVREFPEVRRG